MPTRTNTNLTPSFIRTGVPLLIGSLLTFLSTRVGLVVDEGTQAQGILFFTTILTGLYYGIVRFLEQRYPQIGWLIGLATQPDYIETTGKVVGTSKAADPGCDSGTIG